MDPITPTLLICKIDRRKIISSCVDNTHTPIHFEKKRITKNLSFVRYRQYISNVTEIERCFDDDHTLRLALAFDYSVNNLR